MSQLEEKRRRVEESFERLSSALHGELGWMPRTASWVLPLAAFALGFAVACSMKRRKMP